MKQFRPGQLVVLAPELVSAGIGLYNFPTRRDLPEKARIIARFRVGQIALVITQDRTTCGEVYIVCPDGGGWIQCACLNRLG
jgi:hypothetical protein